MLYKSQSTDIKSYLPSKTGLRLTTFWENESQIHCVPTTNSFIKFSKSDILYSYNINTTNFLRLGKPDLA